MLDDADLSPAAFRLLCHLVRRGASQEAGAWGSIEGMAKTCRMDVRRVKNTLRELIEAGWITRTSRPGFTSIYRLITQAQNQPRGENNPGSKTTHPPGSKTTHPPGSKTTHEGVTGRNQEKDTPLIPQGGQEMLAQSEENQTGHLQNGAESAKKRKGVRARQSLDSPAFPEGLPAAYHGPLSRWFAYKRERGQRYTPTGWQTLIEQQQRFPAAQVTASVEASMASNWAGLFTERIQQQQTFTPTRNGHTHPSEASTPLQVQPQSSLAAPPDGYEAAMAALFGDDWTTWHPGWYAASPTDRASVLTWLQTHLTTTP